MKEEELIKKWLNDELSPEELEAFKKLDAYSSYVKLSEKASHFKAPKFNEAESLEHLKFRIKSKSSKHFTSRFFAGLIAVFIIVFAVVKLLNKETALETYTTEVAASEIIHLPDQSEINLSANSSVSYDSQKWSQNRNLTLKGEAFFKVKKGEKFTVNTYHGAIEVLGTQFNVKSRNYGFEVTCFEGSVGVTIDDKQHILEEKDQLVLTHNSVKKTQTHFETPDWTRNSTVLKSTPLEDVLKEFENYYDVDFETSSINTSRLYTGSFTHSNIEIALKSITLPLDLTYKIKDKKVILTNK